MQGIECRESTFDGIHNASNACSNAHAFCQGVPVATQLCSELSSQGCLSLWQLKRGSSTKALAKVCSSFVPEACLSGILPSHSGEDTTRSGDTLENLCARGKLPQQQGLVLPGTVLLGLQGLPVRVTHSDAQQARGRNLQRCGHRIVFFPIVYIYFYIYIL